MHGCEYGRALPKVDCGIAVVNGCDKLKLHHTDQSPVWWLVFTHLQHAAIAGLVHLGLVVVERYPPTILVARSVVTKLGLCNTADNASVQGSNQMHQERHTVRIGCISKVAQGPNRTHKQAAHPEARYA